VTHSSIVASCIGVLCALALSPPVVAQTMIATSVIFALICGLSGFLGVSITTSIQRYANRLGKSEEAMGLSALIWTAAFALGGFLASGATDTTSHQQRLLMALGITNIIYANIHLWTLRNEETKNK